MNRAGFFLMIMLSTMIAGQGACAEGLAELGKDVWAWRAQTQPTTGDDVPRIVRPEGWAPDWSPAAVSGRYDRLMAFEGRWKALAHMTRSPEEQTDYRLVGSLLARVRWELDHVAAWKRQPHFYIAQTLTPIFEVLLPPPPVDKARFADVLRLVRHIPATLDAARHNLTDRRGPFVEVALKQLDGVPATLRGMAKGLAGSFSASRQAALDNAVKLAIEAFAVFRIFLETGREGLDQTISVGRESYGYFLKEVALYPYSPEELLLMGEQEWARTAAFEAFEKNRNRGLEDLPIAATVQDVVTQLDGDERNIRRFLKEKQIITVPDWVGHYYAQPLPDYLRPMAWLGRTFDLTNETRLDQNATVYMPDPSPDLGFFNLSVARDPRPIIVHEGVPGHYFQLSLSWAHPNPLRRHYYDSGANEGTGFYAEEMMLQAGFFDNSPKTREVIYSFARLRALRVDIDVKLALGDYTIAAAADYLEQKMGMDRTSAEEEAVFFAATPGQAIGYQIGKLQTIEFLSVARMKQGKAFSLRDFHDYLWLNGNVPIALLEKEYLAE
ncbi:MAG: DUF885 domain-containing protein [Alphaproteobacteria bacterium]|nr:MAG: DUF885 domain-containing protein [Alphaproteobacteria bacterium]